MTEKEKTVWIIRYSDGTMESVVGTLEDAARRAETYVEKIRRAEETTTSLSSEM